MAKVLTVDFTVHVKATQEVAPDWAEASLEDINAETERSVRFWVEEEFFGTDDLHIEITGVSAEMNEVSLLDD